MHLVYIDESGDPGKVIGKSKTGTNYYTLSALIVDEKHWLDNLNSLIRFRRYLRDQYGIRMKDELKAAHFIHNSGPFAALDLSDKKRMNIYKMALRRLSKLSGLKTWAVLFRKEEWEKAYPKLSTFETAWQNTIERIERFSTKNTERCIVFPDEGSNAKIQSLMRQLRRYSRPQSHYEKMTLKCNAELILEDPNFRNSNSSYYVQFADYISYAASRAIYPKPWCSDRYWEYLGNIRDDSVNLISRKSNKKGLKLGIAVKP